MAQDNAALKKQILDALAAQGAAIRSLNERVSSLQTQLQTAQSAHASDLSDIMAACAAATAAINAPVAPVQDTPRRR